MKLPQRITKWETRRAIAEATLLNIGREVEAAILSAEKGSQEHTGLLLYANQLWRAHAELEDVAEIAVSITPVLDSDVAA